MAEMKEFPKPTISKEQIDQVKNVLSDLREESPSATLLANLPSNNGVLERDPKDITEEGESTEVEVMVNPDTGERVITSWSQPEVVQHPKKRKETDIVDADDPDLITDQEIQEAFVRMNDAGADIDERPVDMQELQDAIDEDMTIFEDVKLSMQGASDLLVLINRVIKGEDFNYRSLPDEVQRAINLFMRRNGMAGYSVQSNSYRNSIAKSLIEGFTQDVMMKRYISDFNTEMQKIVQETGEELTNMYAEYNEERIKKMQEYLDKMDDPEKKQKLKDILDAINDGFDLNRLKEAARNHKIKIKKFDLEKPKRAIDRFLTKYEKSTQNIYSPWLAMKVLSRHAPELSVDDIHRFFVGLCKYCDQFEVTDTPAHAFTYYALYNCIQLDTLSGEKKLEFKKKYIKNVKEVIALLSPANSDKK